MATNRDRLNQMRSLNRNQEQGLQQILEPSISDQAQQKIRRKTIYTRTDLVGRNMPEAENNTVPLETEQQTLPSPCKQNTAHADSLLSREIPELELFLKLQRLCIDAELPGPSGRSSSPKAEPIWQPTETPASSNPEEEVKVLVPARRLHYSSENLALNGCGEGDGVGFGMEGVDLPSISEMELNAILENQKELEKCNPEEFQSQKIDN